MLALATAQTLSSNCGTRRVMQQRFSLIWVLTLGLFLGVFAGLASTSHASDSLVSLEGPDVTIIAGTERTIYEYRQNGQLRMVKIVPNWGKPYFLVPADPTKGYGDLEQAERLIPSWKLIEF